MDRRGTQAPQRSTGKTRIGLLYAPGTAFLDLGPVQEQARAAGLTLLVAPLGSIKDVPGSYRRLAPQVEVVWVFTDPVVLNNLSMQYIVLQALSSGLPLFCGDAKLARGGATAALVPDLADAGLLAARTAQQLLQGAILAEPGSIIYPKGKLILNQKTAALLKITFPAEAVHQAFEVIQ